MSESRISTKPHIRNPREYTGPVFLRQGFRPFFLGAAVWSAVAMTIWLIYLSYGEAYYTFGYLTPHEWHMHEMLFGFLPAAIAGFLLTAVPNWTGRLPVRGNPLGLLAGLWLTGRLSMLIANAVQDPYHLIIAIIDCLFLLSFSILLAREILVGRNWKNMPVVVIVTALATSNIAFHLYILEFISGVSPREIAFTAIMLAVVLVTLIGGRIVPSFTRNWMVRNNISPLPSPQDRIDQFGIALVVVCTLLLISGSASKLAGILCLLTAAVHLYRLSRWYGWSTRREPMVIFLHIGYSWIAIGFLLAGLTLLIESLSLLAAIHAFSAGMLGTMVLAVMARATRGHTGQPLEADFGTTLIFILINLSAIVRVTSALGLTPQWGYVISGVTWVAAFSLFSTLYLPYFIKR